MIVRARGLVWLASAMVLLQTAAVVMHHFGVFGTGPQGRYLFPVLPGVFTLLWMGWRRWFAPERIPLAATSLLAVFAVLNATAWLLVILPVYA